MKKYIGKRFWVEATDIIPKKGLATWCYPLPYLFIKYADSGSVVVVVGWLWFEVWINIKSRKH